MKYRIMIMLAFMLVAACNNDHGKHPSPTVHTVPVTLATAQPHHVMLTESAVGRILNPHSVRLAAEVAAKVIWIGVDVGYAVKKGDVLVRLDTSGFKSAVTALKSEVARLDAKIGAQSRLVKRYKKLVNDQFISPTAMDRAAAELTSLTQARAAAKARYAQAVTHLGRTRVNAPVSGDVQHRFVAAGDFIKAGGALLDIVADGHLIVSIPFPETRSGNIKTGQKVTMHLPHDSAAVHGIIKELTPMVGQTSGSFQARVDVSRPEGWRSGGSVLAEVVIGEHPQAVMVPESSVVLRPAGEVVYIIQGNTASERKVATGVHQHGLVEILDGLHAGEKIAEEGAAFLTNRAHIQVRKP